jgi:hypothetical protein
MRKFLKILPLFALIWVMTTPVQGQWIISNDVNVGFKDNATIDAFGRARVSNPETIFYSKLIDSKDPNVWDEQLNGTGASVFADTISSVVLTTAANSDYAIRQTYMRFSYQPGKSQRILLTGLIGLDANTTKRYGYYNSGTTGTFSDSLDGIWFEVVGNSTDSLYWCVARQGNIERVPIGSWNIDVFDGNGASEKTLDVTKSQIMIIDFGWLGYSRVRVGFVIDGAIYYGHQFTTSNIDKFPYMVSANHSIRGEIRQTGAGSGTLIMTCSSVDSEGGTNVLGDLHSANSAGTTITAATEDSSYALIGIRVQEDARDIAVELANISLAISSASEIILWELWLDPPIDGTFTYADHPNAEVQIANGSASTYVLPGGTLVASGFAVSTSGGGGLGNASAELENAIRLGVGINGSRTQFVLSATPIAGTTNAALDYALSWRELH